MLAATIRYDPGVSDRGCHNSPHPGNGSREFAVVVRRADNEYARILPMCGARDRNSRVEEVM